MRGHLPIGSPGIVFLVWFRICRLGSTDAVGDVSNRRADSVLLAPKARAIKAIAIKGKTEHFCVCMIEFEERLG
jgi:hypothetical protein